MLGKSQKIYRFAVYGRAASGKTCILAALAMKCVAHPSKFTSTWILEPAGMPRPAGEPETWDVKDHASAFHLGKIWLEKAIERLGRGELPPPNPNRAEPLRYLYHFTTPSHRTYPVELIDYSGELIDPSLSNDDMARQLREHLSSMDGILVLAEAPHPEDDEPQPLYAELHKLEQAFAILKDENKKGPTLDMPLALLINKWDRRSSLRYTTPADEYRELLQFLEKKPEPPHKSLVDALKNSVTKENFQIFPVSAFGAHEFSKGLDESIIERPKSVAPLQSFGLEDGFIWAAQRRDTIDVEHFMEQISEKSGWCFLRNASVVFSLPLIGSGRELAHRFPKGSDERKKINQTLKHYFLTISTNAVCLLLILFAIFTAGEAGYDNFRYRSILTTKSDPQASLQKLQEDEAWLAAYYKAPIYRHLASRFLVVDSSTAMTTLQAFRDRREEMQWRPVEEASDELLRIDLAREYLRQFGENGLHADSANAIVIEAEQTRKYQSNRNFIEKIATAFETSQLKGAQSEQELENLYQQLLTLPFTEAVKDDLHDRQQELLRRISAEKIKLAKDEGQRKWLTLRDQYLEAMREGDLVLAVKALDRLRAKTVAREETRKLEADFKKRAVSVLTNLIDGKARQKLWNQAHNLLQRTLDDQAVVAQLGAAQLKKLQSLHDELDIGEDRELYAQVVKYKNQERVNQYLKYAPLQKMTQSVSRYRQYLNQLTNPLDLKLILDNFNWEGNCRPNSLLVTFNGKTIIDQAGFNPSKRGVSAQIGSIRFREKLSDIAKIYAKATCTSWFSEKTGEANWQGAIGSLYGLRLKLAGKNTTANGSVTFTLSGLPEEPTLPAWGS